MPGFQARSAALVECGSLYPPLNRAGRIFRAVKPIRPGSGRATPSVRRRRRQVPMRRIRLPGPCRQRWEQRKQDGERCSSDRGGQQVFGLRGIAAEQAQRVRQYVHREGDSQQHQRPQAMLRMDQAVDVRMPLRRREMPQCQGARVTVQRKGHCRACAPAQQQCRGPPRAPGHDGRRDQLSAWRMGLWVSCMSGRDECDRRALRHWPGPGSESGLVFLRCSDDALNAASQSSGRITGCTMPSALLEQAFDRASSLAECFSG